MSVKGGVWGVSARTVCVQGGGVWPRERGVCVPGGVCQGGVHPKT